MGAEKFITHEQARNTLLELFNGVHQTMVAQNNETQCLIAQLRADVQQALVANKAAADEQVEVLRGYARDALAEVDNKVSVIDEGISLHSAARLKDEEDFKDKMQKFETGIHEFADRTQASIQALNAEAGSSEGSSLARPAQEKDRPVFDPRDYKIEVIPSQMSSGVWKKWKHEV